MGMLSYSPTGHRTNKAVRHRERLGVERQKSDIGKNHLGLPNLFRYCVTHGGMLVLSRLVGAVRACLVLLGLESSVQARRCYSGSLDLLRLIGLVQSRLS